MGRIRGHWNSLSGEAKLGVVVMPIILALLAGVVSPLVVKRLSQEPAPERRGVVKILDVETNVPLSDFSAQHAAARLQPQDYVLASVAEGLPAGEQQPAPSDSGAGDLGGGDAGASGVPGDSGDGGEPGGNGDPGENGDPDDGDDSGEGDDPGTGDDPGIDDDPGEDDDPAAGGGSGTGAGPEAGGETKDIDGDGVADADDLCPTSAGNLPNGCRAAQLRTEPFGCTEQDMVATLTAGGAGTERCEDLTAVLGPTTGDAPGEVDERADAVSATLHEIRSVKVRGDDERLEPLGVAVTIQVTVTGLEGEEVDVRWSLRHADGRRLPHKWLRNRTVMKLEGEAQSDTGSARFWVPLPKRPSGPYYVHIAMHDHSGTPLTFKKTKKIR